MEAKNKIMEKEMVEKELSLLIETTLRLEDDLNSFVKTDRE